VGRKLGGQFGQVRLETGRVRRQARSLWSRRRPVRRRTRPAGL
jgi:hypothetical protein